MQRVPYTARPPRRSDDAVLLVGHGTVTSYDEVPRFLRRIRRGREPSSALIEEIRRRYEIIGGSPLLEISRRQAAALERRLGIRVGIGMRMSEPFLGGALEALVNQGAEHIVVLPLAPFSVGVYTEAAREAAVERKLTVALVAVEVWATEPALVDALTDRIRPFLSGRDPNRTALILTAHSLPGAVIAAGDRYAEEFTRCANAVMSALGRTATIAYQSQGEGGGQWLGPSLRETMQQARDGGASEIVLAPIGFLADHLETLYDLDVEARRWAADLGISFSRVPALNDHPRLIDAMAAVADRALSCHGRPSEGGPARSV